MATLLATHGNVVETYDENGKRFYSEFLHITDDDSAADSRETCKTRCGRTVTRYSAGAFSTIYNRLCPRCGSEQDFLEVRLEVSEREKRAEEARRQRENEQVERSRQHARNRAAAAKEMAAALRAIGATVEVKPHYQGANLDIAMNGYKFELKVKYDH